MCLRYPRKIVDVFSRLSSLSRAVLHFCACMFASVHFWLSACVNVYLFVDLLDLGHALSS